MAFIYDLSDTWNNAGISFSGIKINVTDSASAAGSKLLDLQIGSASKFTVGKTGTVTATGIIESTVGGFRFPDGTTQITRAVTSVTSTDGSVAITGTTSVDLSAVFATSASNLLLPVRNTTGATLTKGTAVYISGATGQISTVSKAIATGDATSAQTLGLVTANIANNANGNVTLIGTITNIDTSAYADGQQLYLSPTTAGTLTATKPYAPQHLVYMAVVEHAHPTQGKLFVKVQNGYELDELHDVSAQSPSNNHGIFYNTATSLWENKSIVTALGYTPYNATNPAGYTTNVGTVTSVAGTGTVNGLTLTGTVTTSGSLTLGGTLGNIANSQLTNSAITINGTSTALGGSISVGTVTSVAALTLGTSGTDLASSVANGTTTPVITLNVPTASATNRGALSSSDWSIFNAKQAALVSGTNIKTVGGASLLGSGDVGAIGLAYGGTGATTASGARTALGLGTAAVLNAGVAGGVATLDGSGTVPTSQLPGAVLGGLNYQGTWNASTNTPTLASSTGSKGHYYVVSVAGSTNLNGITDWKIGDWAVYDGTTWQKVDNTDAVSSVNGFTGAVVLTTSDVAQGTNLYFTQAAARGSVSAGTGISYNSGTGVITNSAPDQTVALTGAGTTVVTGTYPNFTITSNDSTVGTVTSVAASGGTTGLTFTGSPITTAGTLTLGGTLAVANGGTGATTLSSGYLVKGNGTSAVSASLVYDNGTNVGIGTASPARKLDVNGSIRIADSQALEWGGTAYAIVGDNAGAMIFKTASSERMRIDGSGNVGIGTSAPKLRLQVTGAATAPAPTLGVASGTAYFTSNNDAFGLLAGLSGNGDAWLQAQRTDATATAYNILLNPSGGNVGIGTASPITRLHVSQSNSGNYASVVLLSNSADAAADRTGIYGSPASGTANPYRGGITFWPGSSGAVSIHTGNNTTPGAGEAMRIDGTGNVGIGTSSPTAKLDVRGTSYVIGTGGTRVTDAVGENGFEVVPAATNNVLSYNRTTSSYLPIRWRAGVQSWEVDNTERMRITATGAVGIGTTSPGYTLDVRTNASNAIRVGSNGNSFGTLLSWDNPAGEARLSSIGAYALTFGTNTTERMRITSAGDVGIATAAPGTRLDVVGPDNSGAQYRTSTRTIGIGSISGVNALYGGSGTELTFHIGSERMRINSSGNVGIGTTSVFAKLEVNGNIRTTTGSGGTVTVFETDATRANLGTFGADASGAYIDSSYSTGGSGAVLFRTIGTERMRINSSGNVGVGTAFPEAHLTVSGGANSTSGAMISIYETSTGNDARLRIVQDVGAAYYDATYGAGSNQHIWKIGGTERMRITSAGDVGIGTTSYGGKLTIIPAANPTTASASTNQIALGEASNNTAYRMNIGYIFTGGYASSIQSIAGGVPAYLLLNADGGSVGIGTYTPTLAKLQVVSAGAGASEIVASNTLGPERIHLISRVSAGNSYLQAQNSNCLVGTYDNYSMQFLTNNTERMRIDTSGNVGIGTSAPQALFTISSGSGTKSVWQTTRSFTVNRNFQLAVDEYVEGAFTITPSTAIGGSTYTTPAVAVMGAGNVGIGETAPGSRLQVNGNIRVSNGTTFPTGNSLIRSIQAMSGSANQFVSSSIDFYTATFTDNGQIAFSTGLSERARIDGDGVLKLNVGGVVNTHLFNYNESGGEIQLIDSTGAGPILIDNVSGLARFYKVGSGAISMGTTGANYFQFITNGTERMRIDASGHLLVGKSGLTNETTTDGFIYYKNASGGGSTLYATNGGNGTAMALSVQADTNAIQFFRSGTLVGSVSLTSSNTAYNTSSDYRLKEIDGPIANSGAYIDALKPVQGSWKADGSRFIGLLAHEVQEVSETPIATGEKDGEEMQAMDYSAPELIANLIAEIQSLRARVAQLEGN